MHEKALEYKQRAYPGFHSELQSTLVSIAEAYFRLADYARSYTSFERAYEISKMVKGDFDVSTADLLFSMGECKFKLSRFADSIKVFEHAGMLYSRLENQEKEEESEARKCLF